MSKHTVAKKAMAGSPPSKDPVVTEGSDNPFADLGFSNPGLKLAKSRLVMEMARASFRDAEAMHRSLMLRLFGTW